MTFNKAKLVAAIEADINKDANQVEVKADTTDITSDERPLTLEEVKDRMTSFNDTERPVKIRNVEYFEALSKNNNPYVKIRWQSMYLDTKSSEWRDKKGVIFDGQGKLVHDYLVEFGINEEDTYIVRSKKVKGNDGREFSQWVSFCHIDAYDEVA